MKYFSILLLLASFPLYASQCIEQVADDGSARWIHCPRQEIRLFPKTKNQRDVLWQLPVGTPPTKGWPAVLLSQGSWFPVEFSRPSYLPFGGFNEVRLIRELLDHGYAVIAPRATLNVGWITNMPHGEYEKTADYKVLNEVLNLMGSGSFGEIDMSSLYATGISSGGYNTSRLVLTFPGIFKAIAIQSGSFADCLGPLCSMPDSLPDDHPPTLFLHGQKDIAVPVETAVKFHELLKDEGIESEMIIDPQARHAWIDVAPEAIRHWFSTH
jgi:poly(3-hydroxyoctanoate) depolymerase